MTISDIGQWAIKEEKKRIRSEIEELLGRAINDVHLDIFGDSDFTFADIVDELFKHGEYEWFSPDDMFRCSVVIVLDALNTVTMQFREVNINQKNYIVLQTLKITEAVTKQDVATFILNSFEEYDTVQDDKNRFVIDEIKNKGV